VTDPPIPEHAPPAVLVRFATLEDVRAIAALHASRIAEGFLVTLGPAFLRRLYRRVILSPGSFLLVADDDRSVCGFIAVAENTRALYREYLLRDGAAAAIAAARGIARAPRHVWETLRYGLRAGDGDEGSGAVAAEILATTVAADHERRGIGSRLVRTAVEELERRGVASARVVTAVGNVAAVHAYERGGFRSAGRDEVHRGVQQELLVWP
jgi:ribosomal protein S18 acetylase RimI-like enzyme